MVLPASLLCFVCRIYLLWEQGIFKNNGTSNDKFDTSPKDEEMQGRNKLSIGIRLEVVEGVKPPKDPK
jgi:hypothetical protein